LLVFFCIIYTPYHVIRDEKCSRENRTGYQVTNYMVRHVHEITWYTRLCTRCKPNTQKITIFGYSWSWKCQISWLLLPLYLLCSILSAQLSKVY
jgi:hypothetical protein